jgi:hypothetical protein
MLFKRDCNDTSPADNTPDPSVTTTLEPAALAPLEDWLDAACAPLIGRITYIERQELRNEMRQHLHSLVLAHREMGEPAEVAVDKALRKFGDPATVARQWKDYRPLDPPQRRAATRHWSHAGALRAHRCIWFCPARLATCTAPCDQLRCAASHESANEISGNARASDSRFARPGCLRDGERFA